MSVQSEVIFEMKCAGCGETIARYLMGLSQVRQMRCSPEEAARTAMVTSLRNEGRLHTLFGEFICTTCSAKCKSADEVARAVGKQITP